MLRSVIFDLDGLLVDSEMTAYHVDRDILRAYGYEFSMAHYAEKYCGRTILRNMTDFIAEYTLPITVEEGVRQYEEREAAYIQRAEGARLRDLTGKLQHSVTGQHDPGRKRRYRIF